MQRKKPHKRPGLEQQSNAVMAAAIELFGLRGTKSVSVSDICAQAQVSRDTYYRCFADKEALLSQLYQTTVNDHIELVLASWNLDYADQQWLHQACDQTIDAILAQHKLAQLLFVESADPQSYAYRVVHTAYNKVARRMQRWCRENLRTVPSREFFVALLVATQWLLHNAIMAGMSKREINKAKIAVEQLFNAAFSSMAAAPSKVR